MLVTTWAAGMTIQVLESGSSMTFYDSSRVVRVILRRNVDVSVFPLTLLTLKSRFRYHII